MLYEYFILCHVTEINEFLDLYEPQDHTFFKLI